jgi:hypothetical protein
MARGAAGFGWDSARGGLGAGAGRDGRGGSGGGSGMCSERLHRGHSAVVPALRELTLSFWRQWGQAKRMGMAGSSESRRGFGLLPA